ncbi:hypothetical protein KOR34_09060 [Posidoniimonas corsicana]|uniref:Carboxypeptidase regulatory-like domain-containing protein n=1 Tax=Posidoniimonas corsicana TaxID=1938618 RepID=A0A5C5VDM9_9BACT|nr:hypothetical protein [Posidoniimonas corsicana]TWT36009.1 hypothetical protein KOR34_09060 [Posidoniimonas corsicana]
MPFSTQSRPLQAVCCSFLMVSLTGCGGDYRQVSGVVTIDGKPLETGRVKFFPEAGRPAIGEITGGGRYTLTTIDPGDGALPGDYTVTVESTKYSASGRMASSLEEELSGVGVNVQIESQSLVPARYSNRGDTPIKVTVKPNGLNEIDLVLESS